MVQPLFAAPAAGVVRVALPVPLDELFDYAVPTRLIDAAQPGCRVQVRFRERHLTGVIVERSDESSFTGRLRPIEKIVDREPVLSPALLAILREAADDVLCPLGIALTAALPTGSAPRVAKGFAITPRGGQALRVGALGATARRVLEALALRPRTAAALRGRGAEALPAAAVAQTLRDLERDGFVERRGVEQAPAAREATERVVELAPDVDADTALAGDLARAPRQAELLRRIASGGAVALRELTREIAGAPSLVRSLASRGLVQTRDRAAPRDVLGTPLETAPPVSLSDEQAAALKPIADAVRSRRAESFLLHGVTGSGKTEVYLRAVAEALRCGRQALVLVPEITLTHQILARLRSRFGDALAVLHSGLRAGERLEQWQRLRAGSTPIAVGARSALFAPLENLGVIVIDEEHDLAYKNEEGFRYHARDIAARRAAQSDCPVILGSATPALETRFAADRDRLRRLVLASRIGDRPLPSVQIVDLSEERRLAPRGRRIILSRALDSAMSKTLAEGGQTILLLNRRGFSTQVLCMMCGHVERCRNCDIALVFHAGEQALRCHYCDFRIPPPTACAGCGSPDTALLGLGTERLEEEVRTRFPEARIARFDRDTAQRRGHVEQVLHQLRDGEVDVLVGTQMVAKGHDFPGVRLVGVVLADIGLHLPDFRASERTFQLLTQVAGRAGRDAAPGRVVVQTFTPDHYAIRPVSTHDYETFYAEELEHRAALGYPPFGHLAYALVSDPDEARAEDAARVLAAAVRAADPASAAAEAATHGSAPVVLGPAPAPLARLRGRFRYQLLVKGADRDRVRRAARVLQLAAARLPDGVQVGVDTNPVNML